MCKNHLGRCKYWDILLRQADAFHNLSIENEGYIFSVDGDVAYEETELNIFGVDD